jgi:glycosyltransferase involved in cell wall biosynthesis
MFELNRRIGKWLGKSHSPASIYEKWIQRAVLDRITCQHGLVSRKWRQSLSNRRRSSGEKIFIGFGPVVTGERELHTRKYRIDPIVDYLNTTNRYVADIFFRGDDLSRFDIVVVSKDYEDVSEHVKASHRPIVYDIVDKRFVMDRGVCKDIFLDGEAYWNSYTNFIKQCDGIILSSPRQMRDLKDYTGKARLIEHPVINTEYKSDYRSRGEIRVIWQGYVENRAAMDSLHSVLDAVSRATGRKLRMVYSTNMPTREYDSISFERWTLAGWQSALCAADIGIVLKPMDDEGQRRKPSNKILSYMAAGLPTICTPTPADELVMEHGVTGYFAYSQNDWVSCLLRLVESRELREGIGRAAREHANRTYSVSAVGMRYVEFFDELNLNSGH